MSQPLKMRPVHKYNIPSSQPVTRCVLPRGEKGFLLSSWEERIEVRRD